MFEDAICPASLVPFIGVNVPGCSLAAAALFKSGWRWIVFANSGNGRKCVVLDGGIHLTVLSMASRQPALRRDLEKEWDKRFRESDTRETTDAMD